MDVTSLKFGIPEIELTSISGVKINPSSFAGHELVIVFCPNERAAAAKEIDLYQRHCPDFVERDAWILAFSEHGNEATIDGPGRILTIPDTDRQAWSAFRDLADRPEALDRALGATFLFTRGGNLHRYWPGSEHVDEVLSELKDPSVEHAAANR